MKELTIIIPICNEEGNIIPLYEEIVTELEHLESPYEILFVNDGSTDDSNEIVNRIANIDPQVSLIHLERNIGQGLALMEGVKKSKYEKICILDGDRQFYPKDIIKFLNILLDNNYDFVCGKRTKRSDEFLLKILPSVLGNKFISFLFGSDFQDIGCSLKIVQKEHLLELKTFKNIHRYINILLWLQGRSYFEESVEHRYRTSGKTKYTMFKFLGVIFEVVWLRVTHRNHQVKILESSD